MWDLLQTALTALPRLDLRSLLDILIVGSILYAVFVLLRGTTAMSLLRGIAIVVVVSLILANVFQLTMLTWLLRNSIPAMIITIPIIFQPELRRALERVGRTGWAASSPIRRRRGEHAESVAVACRRLADRRCGALIVVERETGLQEYADTGVEVDAAISVELLITLFFPNSPLHDGAVILRENRIVAAGCVLPLSDNAKVDGSLGTRHRAALGISERSDALCIAVSEESGSISVASNGRLHRNVDDSRLRRLLTPLRQSTTFSFSRTP